MRRRALLLAVVLLAAGPAAAEAAPTGPLSATGRWITDARGRVVLLHGVNMVYKRPPYRPDATGFGADDARFLHDNGLDGVRLGIIYKALEPRPGVIDRDYLDRIARTVTTLARAGVFTQLDFHQDLYNERFQGEGFPDWAVQDDGLAAQPQLGFPGNYVAMPALWHAYDHFWANDRGPGGVGLQDRYAAAFGAVAERFRNDRGVLGYDLFNEPWPGSPWATCIPLGCRAFDAKLTAFERRVTTAIRRADARHVVWYEPHVLFNYGVDTFVGDIGPRTGMSFHDYCLFEHSSASAPLDPILHPTCSRFDDLVFRNAVRRSERMDDPLVLSEFGATDDLTTLATEENVADRNLTSWLYWHYCQCADPTTSGGGPTQALVIDPAKPLSGANVRSAKLDVLSRPYPQAVAGVPRSFRFDPATRGFELSYSTARAGGGALAFGADTQVFVPARLYRRGYSVSVRGAEPLSFPGAQLLRLRTCRGRSQVTLTLRPGGGRSTADCRAPRSTPARLRLSVRPRTTVAGARTTFRFRVNARVRGRLRAVRGARIGFAGRTVRTDRRGRARLTLRLRRPGRYRARATRRGLRGASAVVRVRRR